MKLYTKEDKETARTMVFQLTAKGVSEGDAITQVAQKLNGPARSTVGTWVGRYHYNRNLKRPGRRKRSDAGKPRGPKTKTPVLTTPVEKKGKVAVVIGSPEDVAGILQSL